MDDLDPSKAENLDDLVKCLKQLHIRAGEPSLRELQKKSSLTSGSLPGMRIMRVTLGRSTLSDVMNGRKRPTKAFLLTLVEAFGVDLKADHRWAEAWDRLAVRGQQADKSAGEAERLLLENEELRQRLAEARNQVEATRTQGQRGQHLAADNERAAARQQDSFDPGVLKQWLDDAPTTMMRDLTELRQAIEPLAASLAAQRPSADVCRDLVIFSRRMQELGEDDRFSEDNQTGRGIREDYQDVDALFHDALLMGSQNQLFYALKEPVRAALNYRIHKEWEGTLGPSFGTVGTRRFPIRPAPLSLWLHRGLAAAVARCQPAEAEIFSRAVLAEIGTDSLPTAYADTLERALTKLDPTDGTDWERFRYAIRAAILSSRASASAPGPIVVMGVAGCGKTTVAQLLAGSLRVPYAEADSFHPPDNVARMAAGNALTDQDRRPWLHAIADRIRQDSRLVVSCSALKRSYRDVLRQGDPRTWFLHLAINQETAAARVAGRATHFMPASLVDSQFADLEPLLEEEAGLTIDGTLPREQILATAVSALAMTATGAERP